MEATLIYPERNLWAAARDGLIWLSGPVSERGAASISVPLLCDFQLCPKDLGAFFQNLRPSILVGLVCGLLLHSVFARLHLELVPCRVGGTFIVYRAER